MKFATVLLSVLIGAVAATPVVQPNGDTGMKLALRAPVPPTNGGATVRQIQRRQSDGCLAAPPVRRTDMKRNIPQQRPQQQARRNGQIRVVPRQNIARNLNRDEPAKAPIRRPRADQPQGAAGNAAAGSKKRMLGGEPVCNPIKGGPPCPGSFLRLNWCFFTTIDSSARYPTSDTDPQFQGGDDPTRKPQNKSVTHLRMARRLLIVTSSSGTGGSTLAPKKNHPTMATTDTNAGSMPSPSLTSLISSYGILTSLASYVSTVDLYHLALTDKAHHSYILGSPNLFRSLRRHCLCDGRGLRVRQTYNSPYSSRRKAGKLSINPWMDADEEIEVHLYNVKCDEAGALPCRKCGINVCEECRYYPRACPPVGYPNRFPHLNSPYQMENVMCLCPPCDAEQEKELEGQFLNETCDCDTYKRWVCLRCRREESAFTRDYYRDHTKAEWYPKKGEEETKTSQDHQFERSLWCTCGAKVPQETRFRCTWCKRRHLPESEWGDEFNQPGHRLPFFENDPCYPVWVSDPQTDKYPVPYPPLGRCGERWN